MLGVLGQRLASMSKRGVSTVLAQILATFASVLSALSASMSPTLTGAARRSLLLQLFWSSLPWLSASDRTPPLPS